MGLKEECFLPPKPGYKGFHIGATPYPFTVLSISPIFLNCLPGEKSPPCRNWTEQGQ